MMHLSYDAIEPPSRHARSYDMKRWGKGPIWGLKNALLSRNHAAFRYRQEVDFITCSNT